ncbi:MAG: hypothetical protein EOP11_04865 [Proteobacteria bacterium]|nr:MAG: hypothetical protein EOP11_04865 [Pseudomonadota bacterium]
MSETTFCFYCGRKAQRDCCECEKPICKDDTLFVDKDLLRYHPKPPKQLQQTHFCPTCYERDIQPHVDKYEAVRAKAKDITVVRDNYRGHVPCLKRVNTPVVVKRHADEFHASEHLRYLAALEGYDSIVDFSTLGVQKRNAGWQTTEWSARGYFANLNHKRYRPQDES